jgi:AraC-like DNA-binding protein/quercetin dioxygenase-like cupin family protein
MDNEFSFDYRFAVRSPADAHYAQTLGEMIESAPNPQGLACVQGSAQQYSGRFNARSSGALVLAECQFDSPAGSTTLFSCERTHSHIARNHSCEVQVFIWLGGEASLSTSDSKHTLQAGDFSVTNSDTPYSVTAPRGHSCALTLPTSWERIGDTRLENVFEDIYPGGDRRRNGLVNYARHLLARPNALALPGATEKLYDVIALALNPCAKSEHQAGLLALIRNHIDSHYANPNLDPVSVAHAFEISLRHLHRLFAACDTTFTEYLIEQRLQQAQRMLSDSRYRQQTILGIAFDCGFHDINHFGRRFRARFGFTPGEFRRMHALSDPSPNTGNARL